ncbi:MAG: protein-(glutamine-N5) methyltransferase, release factor-specific [Gallionellales bacterium RIFCSPLOWO2_02_FULL_57_47]|nr:MAG: protein-(glutamine-N5) methyltransferase, release factor-specific [Gallionellales bacterium RIFCSPLOWO2_02_FULL_57_47]OGT18298.1 MAG: protein-(glutamine-N5) methyltransferase, release factor-specific [Gallionellales bacterium RIFCSPHIGHO2_02_FULL_57_16]
MNLDSGSARIEVQCLLQAVLQANRAWLLTHPEHQLDDQQYARYAALFERRLLGEPVAYLLGEREFYGLNFKVSPATLIPRPDTELLVDLALQHIPQQGRCRVLDLGTGSGAIALSIAHARPNAEVVAVDTSTAALEIAQLNAQRLDLKSARFLQGDWFSALHDERFDIVVSNPPYIAAGDAHLARGDVRFEPRSALVSGAEGLDDIRRITAQAKAHLNPDGWLLFEHGYDQAAQVRALLQQAGFTAVFSARDLAGIERVSGGSSPASASKSKSALIHP